MAGQTTYTYQTPKGVPGGLVDINNYSIDSRINGEAEPGVLKFGTGAMIGANPGVNVLAPAAGMTADQFEGVVMTGFTNERSHPAGDVSIMPLNTVGVLRWGRAWVRVDPAVSPEYGDSLYLITAAGDTRGYFTNDDGGGANIAIKGEFIGGLGTGSVAPVVIYNQKAE